MISFVYYFTIFENMSRYISVYNFITIQKKFHKGLNILKLFTEVYVVVHFGAGITDR